jgi:glycosyltransferase involved in cell wall biosynthesis
MNITLIGPVYPYKGGIAHFTTFLAHSIDLSKHEMTILSFERLYPLWLYPGVTDKDPSNAPPWVLDVEYISDPVLPWTWWRMIRRVFQIQPDAVVIQWWTTFFAPMLFFLLTSFRRRGIKVILLIHNVYPHETRPWHRWIAKFILRRVDSFIVQSQAEQQKLRKICPSAKILMREHPIYLWPELEIIPKDEAKRNLVIPKHGPTLLFFGIVRPYKGLQNLLHALRMLQDRGEKYYLIVAGEFWEDVEKYEEIVYELNLGDSVRIIDRYIPNETINIYFSAADIFIAPYSGGTQSGVVKTAMAYGLPVVASDFLFPTESLFHDPEKHLLIHEMDAEHIAAAISEAIHKGIHNKPRRSPEWPDTGWDALVDAIEILARDDQAVEE